MGIGRSRFAWIVVAAIVALGIGAGGGYLLSRSPTASGSGAQVVAATSGERPAGSAPASAAPSAPTTLATASGPPRPSAVGSSPNAATPSAAASGSGPSSSAEPGSSSAPGAAAAPTSAAGFNPRKTVVPIAFPLPATVPHHVQAFWREARLGIVYPYNQISRVLAGGALLRAHDGIDLTAKIGTPVLAPFAGTVVNPAALWKPWDPERYGNVVVIRSNEPTSKGYYAILVHLSTKNVKVGDRVTRGQVVGKSGITGNADGTVPHLHFELRAPFQIAFHYAGVLRMLDGFDPLPSLLAADPKLQTK